MNRERFMNREHSLGNRIVDVEETVNEKVFRLFEGGWIVDRQISPHGSMSGEAWWRAESTGLLSYCERGEMALVDGGRFEVGRRYHYILDEDSIEVRFADGEGTGSVFLRLRFVGEPPRATAMHRCRADVYEAEFSFDSNDCFWITYHVHGPRKNYVSRTRFSRLPER